ncbi:two-component sensor histidine kinase [Sphaerisporangium rufum]|uniref:histidine kinase n=1 Tax=Sphaerisporangium rufum TaxID=1381558 RepID=A0A919R0L2_9ACTN|nr:histidine kinase [Sphaerisporangium rufum]GII77462.1 two-component sensor histidine kinase [Sphaerisporangium rufum]
MSDPAAAALLRARVSDAACVLFGLVTVVAFGAAMDRGGASARLLALNVGAGLAACALLVWRRRHPAGVLIAMGPLVAVSLLCTGAALVAWFTVAAHRRWPVVAGAGALYLAMLPLHIWRQPWGRLDPAALLPGLVVTVGVAGWGMVLRHRRHRVQTLVERAERAEAEQRDRVRQARRLERARIAREMHDVLAHRMSLLSLHAGALEFRPDAPPEEIGRAAGVIRQSAFQALADLQEIIGLLRADETAESAESPGDRPPVEPARPQPAPADLPALVEECRRAGMPVRLANRLPETAAMPATTGRDIYRIVQEGLTNARRHAPGAEVMVTVGGDEAQGIRVEVISGPGITPAPVPVPPGSGMGLLGLDERVRLAGGRLTHAPTADRGFRLEAWLPWHR